MARLGTGFSRKGTLSSGFYRGMVLALVVGVIAGFGAVIFRKLIQLIQGVAFGGGERWLAFLGDAHIVLIPALGGLIFGPLVYWFAREAKGHGVPEVMVAMIDREGKIRPRVALVKILSSALCIGTGGSVGREGPIVQIGSTFGSYIGQKLKLSSEWIKTLVACGAAGGISATFNAPFAGVFFALEVILGRFYSRYFGLVVISSVVAAVVSHAYFPDKANLEVPKYQLQHALELPLYVMLGVLAGVLGVAFIRALYACEDAFERLKFPEPLKPVLGGLGIGALGLYSVDLLGVGYPGVEKAALAEIGVQSALMLMGLKIVATSLTIGSGGSGGVFAPSLFIGAMLGVSFGSAANDVFPDITAPAGAYALVAMGAVFAAAARAPITAVMILVELTRDYTIILPLMLTVVIGMVVSQALSRESIYTLKVRRSGVAPPVEGSEDIMKNVLVRDVMTQDYPTVHMSETITAVAEKFESLGHRGFPVLDDNGELYGIITANDVAGAIGHGKRRACARDVATRNVVTAFPDQSVHEALVPLGAGEVGRIPVVSRENRKRLVGLLRRHDIIRAYADSIEDGEPGSSG